MNIPTITKEGKNDKLIKGNKREAFMLLSFTTTAFQNNKLA